MEETEHPKLTERRTWKLVAKNCAVEISASEAEAIFRSSQKSLATADTQATVKKKIKNTYCTAEVTQSQARKPLIECYPSVRITFVIILPSTLY